jgi:hypothetical protein
VLDTVLMPFFFFFLTGTGEMLNTGTFMFKGGSRHVYSASDVRPGITEAFFSIGQNKALSNGILAK